MSSLLFFYFLLRFSNAREHDLCVGNVRKITDREKIHVRLSVGVDQKNLLNRGGAQR